MLYCYSVIFLEYLKSIKTKKNKTKTKNEQKILYTKFDSRDN